MGIGPADPERAHPRHAPLRPRPHLPREGQRGVGPGNPRGRDRGVQRGYDRSAFEHTDRLDQPGHAGGGLEMPDIALRTAQGDGPGRGTPQRGGQRRDLDRVAQRRAGAMRLDRAEVAGTAAGDRQRLGDHRRLPVLAGRGEPHLAAAVVVRRRPQHQRPDPIPARVLRAAQHHEPAAGAEHRARRVVGEAAAMSVGGEHAPRLVEIPDAVWHPDAHAAGDGHVAFPGQQALAGEMHRDQRR